jgi:hypothetical protein
MIGLTRASLDVPRSTAVLRAPRLLVIRETEGGLEGAVVLRHEGQLLVSGTARAEGLDLDAGLPLLRERLGAGGDAILVTPRVTALCLPDAPPMAGLSSQSLEGLVRWELEALLPPDEGPSLPVCGWAAGPPGGAERAGPLLACGLFRTHRDAAREAFAQAGLVLRGLYPALGCAAALAEPDGTLVEVGQGGCVVIRLEAGRVTAFHAERTTDVRPLERMLLELEGPFALAGSVPDSALSLLPEATLLEQSPEASSAEIVAGMLGAARHALGLPGGERVAAVPGSEPDPPRLRQRRVQVALGVAALALLLGAAELGLGAARGRAEDRLSELHVRKSAAQATWQAERVARLEAVEDETSDLERRALDLEEELAALGDRRLDLEREQEQLAQATALLTDERSHADERLRALERQTRRDASLADSYAQRREGLPMILAAISRSTPADLSLDRFREETGAKPALVLEGFALHDMAVRELARDLARDLAPLGLRLESERVSPGRAHQLGVVGYRFELRFVPHIRES